MKKILRALIVVFVCLFLLLIVKDLVIKTVVSIAATQITGAKVHIHGFSFGVFSQSVRISKLHMHNPAGFSDAMMVDLNKVAVDYDISALLHGKLHLRRVDIDLKTITLEKNKAGKLNVDSLKIAGQQREEKKAKPQAQLALQIDELNLSMGNLVSQDYSAGRKPAVQVYDINLKKTYKNITSAEQLAALLLAEPMKAAGIKSAAIYGVSLVSGVAILPVALAVTFAGKDSVQQTFDIPIDRLYDVSVATLKRSGKVTKEDKTAKVIHADVNGVNITVKIRQLSPRSAQITISARKYMLPKPETARGIIYEISGQLH